VIGFHTCKDLYLAGRRAFHSNNIKTACIIFTQFCGVSRSERPQIFLLLAMNHLQYMEVFLYEESAYLGLPVNTKDEKVPK
jgi:hypothetical protein